MDEQYGAPPTIPQATGNPSMQSLLQMIQQREMERPTYQQQQQALAEYMNAVRNSQPLDDNVWHSMGRGFLSAPGGAPTVDEHMERGFAQAGREIVNRNNLVQQDERAREVLAAKLKYDDIQKERTGIGGFGQGATTAVVQNTLDPFKNAPGVGMISKQSGKLVLPASVQPQYEARWQQNFKLAVEREAADPNAWATQQTNSEFSVLLQNPAIMGGRAQVPPAQPAAQAATAPQDDEAKLLGKIDELNKAAKQFGDNPMILKSVQQQMDQTAAALIELRKRKGIPETAMTVPPAGQVGAAIAPLEPGAPAPLPRVDKAGKAMETKAAEAAGKDLGELYGEYQTASANSAELKMQLNALRQLFTTPNLPQGALGERLQSIRSGLKTIGVDVGPEVGAADMIEAVSGKLALLTRTADGKNLMPGAMSDFEQRILKGLAPGLNQTAEGRAALVEFLSDMADVRIRMASEAQKAAGERGILPPSWYARRDRVLKEEQARLAIKAREIAGKFQGAK